MKRKANQLARQLRKRGVKGDEVVGLYMERSVEMLVGMMGILNRRGIPADRSELSTRTVDVHPGRRHGSAERAVGGSHPGEFEGDKLPEWVREVVSLDGDWEEIEKEEGREYRQQDRSREPGVRDLHERIDREAERGDDRTWISDEPVGGAERRDLWGIGREGRTGEFECANAV